MRSPKLENASVVTVRRIFECARYGRWDEVESLHEPDLRCEDRRRGLRSAGGLAGQMANLRVWASFGEFEVGDECLAIRGEHLSLCRYTATGIDPPSGWEVEFLSVNEVSPSGRMKFYAVFDPGDLREATEEFERRAAAWP